MTHTHTQPNTPARPGIAWLLRLPWQRLVKAIRRWRRELQERRELELLDGNALRDLGLHRSEYLSYLAEASGAADQTRRRISGWTD